MAEMNRVEQIIESHLTHADIDRAILNLINICHAEESTLTVGEQVTLAEYLGGEFDA